MNATSAPSAPGRGCSSINRTPRAFNCASAATMSSTRNVTWCMPAPRFSMYLAIAESDAVASSSSSFESPAGRKWARTRWDATSSGASISRPSASWKNASDAAQVPDRDADVIDDRLHASRPLPSSRKHDAFFLQKISWPSWPSCLRDVDMLFGQRAPQQIVRGRIRIDLARGDAIDDRPEFARPQHVALEVVHEALRHQFA